MESYIKRKQIDYDHPLVKAVYARGGTDADVIRILITENLGLQEELLKVMMIAPRKITVGEQSVIWRCPDAHVPEVKW